MIYTGECLEQYFDTFAILNPKAHTNTQAQGKIVNGTYKQGRSHTKTLKVNSSKVALKQMSPRSVNLLLF